MDPWNRIREKVSSCFVLANRGKTAVPLENLFALGSFRIQASIFRNEVSSTRMCSKKWDLGHGMTRLILFFSWNDSIKKDFQIIHTNLHVREPDSGLSTQGSDLFTGYFGFNLFFRTESPNKIIKQSMFDFIEKSSVLRQPHEWLFQELILDNSQTKCTASMGQLISENWIEPVS